MIDSSPTTVARLLSGIGHWRLESNAELRCSHLDPGRNHPEDPERPDHRYTLEREYRLREVQALLPDDWAARWDGSAMVVERHP